MPIRNIVKSGLAAITGVAMLAGSLSSGSAMTVATPTALRPDASSQIEKVWYCRWNCGGWHSGWGYRASYGWTPGWRGYGWRAPVYYGNPCWRRWIGPYGGVHWRRVC